MTRRENTFVLAGILIGAIIGIVGYAMVAEQKPTAKAAFSDRAIQEKSAGTEAAAEKGVADVLELTDSEKERIGLQTTEVRLGSVIREVVTSARVEELGTAIGSIDARIAGRVDQLMVHSIGQFVRKGQPVAVISTPEPTTLYATVEGVVRTQNVAEGRYISAGEILMTVINLSTVSLRAEVFESDIEGVRPGLAVEVTSDALSGNRLTGVVSSVESRSDVQSGATPVHIKVGNPDMRLKPGMFVRSVLRIPSPSKVLTVPKTAVLDTGLQKIVYRVLDGGLFERREIKVGSPGKENYPVFQGLSEGDKVVTNGAFLIDSQSRLTGSVASSERSSFNDANDAGSQYRIKFQIKPDPPLKGAGNAVSVKLLDPSGTSLGKSQVRLSLSMPAMPSMNMPEMRKTADLRWTGSEYAGTLDMLMAGHWNVVVEAREAGRLLARYRTDFNAR